MKKHTFEQVTEVVKGERRYQEGVTLRDIGDVDPPFTVGEYIVMLQHYANGLTKDWTLEIGDAPEVALHSMRKIAGIAFQCLEHYGAPERERLGAWGHIAESFKQKPKPKISSEAAEAAVKALPFGDEVTDWKPNYYRVVQDGILHFGYYNVDIQFSKSLRVENGWKPYDGGSIHVPLDHIGYYTATSSIVLADGGILLTSEVYLESQDLNYPGANISFSSFKFHTDGPPFRQAGKK